MADPMSIITIAGSIIATCYSYGCAVADAPQVAKSLAAEVSNLSGLLAGINALASANPVQFAALNLPDVLSDCESALRVVSARLEKRMPKKGDSRARLAANRLMWPLDTKATMELLVAVERQKSTLSMVMETFTAQSITMQQQTLGDIKSTLSQVSDQLLKVQMADEQQKILKWLSDYDYVAQDHRAAQLYCSDTCSWIVDHYMFKSWQKSLPAILWFSGMAGCGKTVLTSYVVKYLRTELGPFGSLAYFYYDASTSKSLTLVALLGCILRQLCTPHTPRFIEDIYWTATKHSATPKPLTTAQLKVMLRGLLRQRNKTVIVIDGVDEATESSEVCLWLTSLTNTKDSCARVFVTSRPYGSIRTAMKGVPQLVPPEDSLQRDIRIYIDQRTKMDPGLRKLSDDLKSSIADTLVRNSHGMFRWVQCQLDDISKLRTERAIKRALSTLPRTLEASYNRVLASLPDTDADFAQRILLWLTWSLFPLYISMMADAIAIEPGAEYFDVQNRMNDPQDILEICGTFASYDEDNHIRLAHHSVRDFLSLALPKESPFSLPSKPSHKKLAMLCLSYLLLEDFTDFTSNDLAVDQCLIKYPLLSYAARCWPSHVLKGDAEEELQPLILKLMTPFANAKFLFWLRVIVHYSKTGPYQHHGPQPLYYAVSFGLQETVKSLVSQGVDLNHQAGGYGGTALHAACFRRHPHIVRSLLEAGADMTIKDYKNMTPIDLTEWCEFNDVAQVILDHGKHAALNPEVESRLTTMLRRPPLEEESTGNLRRRSPPPSIP